MNEIRTQASKLRKASVLKWLYKKGVFKQEDLDKLLSQDIEDIAAGVEVDDDSPNSSVMSLQPKNTVADTTAEMRETETDMRETLGYGKNQMGEFSPFHNKTATEAQIVEQASEIRNDERRDIVADVLSNVVRKWNQFIFKYWDEEKIIRVAGPEGAQMWVRYTGEQLVGEFDFKIDPDSGLPMSRGMRYQSTERLLELLKDNQYIDQQGLLKMLLRQFDWLDPVASTLVQEGYAPQEGAPGTTPESALDMTQFQRMLQGAKTGA
jgi:hypothetical protein